MKITPNLTDQAVLDEVGARIARARLERNLSQAEFGEEAGVGRRTVQRLEAGEPAQTTSLIRVLRALDLLEGLERLIPEPAPSPVERLKRAGKPRRRASGAQPDGGDEARPWQWGDEGETPR